MIGLRRDAKRKVNEAKSLRLKEGHQKEYSEIQKEVKKALRTDKRAHIDALAQKQKRQPIEESKETFTK